MMFQEIPAKILDGNGNLVTRGQLIDPIPQLRIWTPKILRLHGKCASVYWDVFKTFGVFCPQPYYHHHHHGFGDCKWTDIISELRRHAYRGPIDIEGWHDPVYRDELESLARSTFITANAAGPDKFLILYSRRHVRPS